jgi:hypothetical protein
MKTLLVIFLSMCFTFASAQTRKHYIQQYSVIQFDNRPFKYACKCYESRFELNVKNMVLEIKTDSAHYQYKIVRANTYGEGTYTLSKDNIPYLMKEIAKHGSYYLIITPIKFNEKYVFGGDFLAISNKKICN